MFFDTPFFPELTRREEYTVKSNGEYYADYSVYRQEIREDCLRRCVYCDVHENENGGEENMHLDHFRPYSYDEYVDLANDPTNLVWSCSGCNRLKSNIWPALGTEETFIDGEGFIDVFEEDRRDYFTVNEAGEFESTKPPARYMITLLALNRQTRKRCRELRMIKWDWVKFLDGMIAEIRHAHEITKEEDMISFLESHERDLRHFRDTLLDILALES